ncbi:MAG: nitrile hydratase subunit beta [Hyphomicrobiaceae bacterium]|nr:nitrile hydratase subunit beta [Hyphomicrobiaceae bacterium]
MSAGSGRPPRFRAGESVQVAGREAVGHCRTPWYLRGHAGVIASVHGAYHDPERLAYHKPGLPLKVLYKVRFRQADLWRDYKGPANDHLEADIYEDWLGPADGKERGR